MKIFVFSSKLLLTALLLWLCLRSLNTDRVLPTLQAIATPAVICSALVLMIVQILLSSVRLAGIAVGIGAHLSLRAALLVVWIGSFFSQVLVTFIGGDVVRAFLVRRNVQCPLSDAVNIVFLDRFVGLLSSALLFVLAAPFTLALIADDALKYKLNFIIVLGSIFLVAAILITMIAAREGFSQRVKTAVSKHKYLYAVLRTVGSGKYIVSSLSFWPRIFIPSLAIQLLNVSVIFILMNAKAETVSFWNCLLIVPFGLFLSLLPISVSGWGVRETALAVGFSLLGIDENTSLSASIMFGLLGISVSIPGSFLWWMVGKPAGGGEATIDCNADNKRRSLSDAP